MKTVDYNSNWVQSWKESYVYDQVEVFGGKTSKNLGYYYAYKMRQRKAFDLLHKYLPVGAEVLDIAAAQGNFSLLLAEEGYKVTWNDLREELVSYVKMKYEKGNIEYLAGNCFEVCKGKLFDAVLITEIIEHVAHPDDFLKLVSDLVKPNGYIIMTTPSGEYFTNNLPKFSEYATPEDFESVQFKPNADGHIFLLHEDEFYDLGKKADLKTLEVSIHTNPLTGGHIKLHKILPFIPKQIVDSIERTTQRLPSKIRKKIHSSWAVVYQKR